jgi:hypothetical protein
VSITIGDLRRSADVAAKPRMGETTSKYAWSGRRAAGFDDHVVTNDQPSVSGTIAKPFSRLYFGKR